MSSQPQAGRGPCSQCSHFRRARLASQLLAAQFEATTDGPEIASALGKIVDDEHKLREAEAETKNKEGSAHRDRWPARPMTSDFCGLEEAHEVYRIAEVKNEPTSSDLFGCESFEPGERERHACANCAHCVPAQGRADDHRMELTYARLMNDAVAARASTQTAEGLLRSYRSGESSRKALEISAAYESKGRMMATPEYFDHCALLSTDDDHVVCALRNPHHTCPTWAPRPTGGESS